MTPPVRAILEIADLIDTLPRVDWMFDLMASAGSAAYIKERERKRARERERERERERLSAHVMSHMDELMFDLVVSAGSAAYTRERERGREGEKWREGEREGERERERDRERDRLYARTMCYIDEWIFEFVASAGSAAYM